MKEKYLIDLHLPVHPAPKERPYFSGKHVFTPEKTRRSEEDIAMLVKNHMQTNKIEKTYNLLYIESLFVFPPKVKRKSKDKDKMFDHLYPKRPDLDNLQKLLYDALSGIAYHDDCQIVHSMAGKMYADEHRGEGIHLKIIEYFTVD